MREKDALSQVFLFRELTPHEMERLLSISKEKKAKKVRYWIQYRLPDGKQKKESLASFKDLNPYSIEDARKAMSKRVQVQPDEGRPKKELQALL